METVQPRGSQDAREQASDKQRSGLVDPAQTCDLLLHADAHLIIVDVAVGPKSDLLGRSLLDVFEPGAEPAVRRAIEHCLKEGQPTPVSAQGRGWTSERLSLRVVPRSDSEGHGLVTVSGIIDPSGHVDQQRRDLAPQITDAMSEIFDLLPVGIFFKDAEGRFTHANQKFLATFGLETVSDLCGQTDFDLHHGADAERYFQVDQEIMASGIGTFAVQEPQTRLDGTFELLHTTKVPWRDAEGDTIGLLGFFAEVTEPTRVADALKTSEQRFALAVRASRDGIWDWDIESRTFQLSARLCQMLGLSATAGEVTWPTVAKLFGPEQAAAMAASITSLFADPTQTVSHTASLVLSDGTTRWLDLKGTALVVDGRTTRVIGSAADVTEERRREDELRYQAHHDDLTDLANRRALIKRLDSLLGSDQGCSLLYLDLDSFKVVNDSLGHEAGDAMLMAVADRLLAATEKADMVARLGGDEFALVIVGDNHRNRSIHLAAVGISAQLSAAIDVGGADLYTTASIGVVTGNDDRRGALDMLRDADTALYRAKESGKGGYSIFEQAMGDAAKNELALQTRLQRAVFNDEFDLHYQPIIDAETLKVTSLEALLRWSPSDGPPESPASFLPYLERSGLILELGAWVLDEGCRQLAQWQTEDERFERVTLSINVSRSQFKVVGLTAIIEQALIRHGLKPDRLTVEVTETAVARDFDQLVARLEDLRALGVRVALDDFGVGQSSLGQLHELPLDILKIDRTFVDRISQRSGEPVLNAALHIANALGLKTVAEGVETGRQVEWLRRNHCDQLQGYRFSPPVAPSSIPELVMDSHFAEIAQKKS